jgi:hypothetical protein
VRRPKDTKLINYKMKKNWMRMRNDEEEKKKKGKIIVTES